MNKIKDQLDSFFKSLPRTSIIYSLFVFLYIKDINSFILLLGLITVELLSRILKSIFKNIIYKNKINLPILGKGLRPQKAKGCGGWGYPNKIPKNFGMPSGHSIFSGFIFTYFILCIWENDNKKNQDEYIILKIIYTILCIFGYIYMIYTRIYFNCHTIQQTIFGTFVGLGLAFFYFYFVKKELNKKFNYKQKIINIIY